MDPLGGKDFRVRSHKPDNSLPVHYETTDKGPVHHMVCTCTLQVIKLTLRMFSLGFGLDSETSVCVTLSKA